MVDQRGHKAPKAENYRRMTMGELFSTPATP